MAILYKVRPESPKIWLSNMCTFKTPSDPPFVLTDGEIPTIHLIPVGEIEEQKYAPPKAEKPKPKPKGKKAAKPKADEEDDSKPKPKAKKKKPALKTRAKKK